jgi:hypothetical protein
MNLFFHIFFYKINSLAIINHFSFFSIVLFIIHKYQITSSFNTISKEASLDNKGIFGLFFNSILTSLLDLNKLYISEKTTLNNQKSSLEKEFIKHKCFLSHFLVDIF